MGHFIDPDHPLPTPVLEDLVKTQNWHPQASGNQIAPELVDEVERMWAEHSGRQVPQPVPGNPSFKTRAGRRGWMRDPVLRTRVENAAQDRLMDHYRLLGYHVEDTRLGHSYDAVATRGEEMIYLEAKGTVTKGDSVIVSRGEVNWALNHPGECVLGILSEIQVTANGDVVLDSAVFQLFEWWPDEQELDAREYDWRPDDEKLLE